MKDIAKIAKAITPSPIRQMFNKALGMTDVVSFTVGEPDFLTPKNVVDAAIRALQNGEHKYTPNAGILPLREAVAKSIQASHHLNYAPDGEVIITAGGMEALMLLMMTILDPGDEVILADPCWTNYSRQVLLTGAVPKFVTVYGEDHFNFKPEALEAAITPKTKAFIINSPANPTGGIASAEQLRVLAEIAVKHDLYVISDEVYSRLLYNGQTAVSIATFPGMKERTIIVNSFSKTYAMTGWRVGFALGPEEIIRTMVKLQENVAACVNSSAQYGALAALTEPQDAVDEMVKTYEKRRDLIVHEFASIPGLKCFTPEGAFYAFIDIAETGMNAMDFANALLLEDRVIVVPGYAFGEGSDHYVRLSFATSEETIKEGTARIRNFMKKRMN